MQIDSRDILNLNHSLAWAISFAAEVHYDQVDKGGQPYILHPIRVMMAVETIEEKIVAILHDVVEDGMVSKSILVEYAGVVIARAVMALSRKDGESYREFILRVKQNNLARQVKIADLKDNMDRSRIPNPTAEDERRWKKYEKALAELSNKGTTVVN